MSATLEKHLFTVEDYMRMADAGVFNGSRVELVNGEIYSMPPQGNLHAIALGRLNRILLTIFQEPWFLRSQGTHRFAKHVALEPDLALLKAEPVIDALIDTVPELVIEISDSTFRYDFETKRLLYAKAGVPDYWVLDVNENQLHVFRNPNSEAAEFESAYRSQQVLVQNDVVCPFANLGSRIELTKIFPLRRM